MYICILMISHVHTAYKSLEVMGFTLLLLVIKKLKIGKLGIGSAGFAAPSVPARPETCGSERNSEKKLLQGVLHT